MGKECETCEIHNGCCLSCPNVGECYSNDAVCPEMYTCRGEKMKDEN